MKQSMDATCFRYGEATTGRSQVIRFMAPDDRYAAVKDFVRKNIATIMLPEEQPVPKSDTAHGAYGYYSRYDIRQHKYAGGGHAGAGGFIELLEIKDAPDGRCGIVIFEECSYPQRSSFSEWESLKQAEEAYEKVWGSREERVAKICKESPGFIRMVPCGYLTPWFYAVGKQQIVDDYAMTPGWTNDVVYRIGKQYVVYNRNGVQTIKTCMGSCVFNKKSEHYPHNEKEVRIVQWHDGTYWSNDDGYGGAPRPRLVHEEEAWIAEAMEQFRELLSGHRKSISVEFTNGMRFSGSFNFLRKQRHTREGRYYAIVKMKGEDKPREGWVDFKPTKECSSVVAFIKNKLEQGQQGEIEYIKIEFYQATGKRETQKLWAGVFHEPPKDIV